MSGAGFKACFDGFTDIRQSFGFGPALGYASGYRRTLGDVNARLVTIDVDEELHEPHSKLLLWGCPFISADP